jgi:hypothetical protein
MSTFESAIDARITHLETSLSRARLAASALGIALTLAVAAGFAGRDAQTSDELRTKRLVVVDDQGTPRVVIGQDPKNSQRRSRAAGITIHDKTGAERGGMSTFDDGSVVVAIDAPVGVGSPMRDRVGMVVNNDGSAHLIILDNQTRGVAKLESDGKGGGGVVVYKWDMAAKQVHVKTLTYDGELRSVHPFGK